MDPPPKYEKHPFPILDSLQPLTGPAPTMGYGTPPPMPPQYQPYYIPPAAGFNPGPSAPPPPHPIIIPAAQHSEAPDYLVYSIFTTLFCCLPVGITAWYYSVQTRRANHLGDIAAARKNSILARNLAHTALGVGLFFIVLCIIIIAVIFNVLFTFSTYEP